MKRKGKKTFRGTALEHEDAAKEELTWFRSSERAFNMAVKENDCGFALNSLANAIRAQGTIGLELHYADMRQASGSPFRRRDSSDKQADSTWRSVNKMQDTFAEKCLRRKK